MIKYIFVFLLLIITIKASPCQSQYNCAAVPGKETPAFTGLTCTLPALPNMPITAQDVFDSNGALKRYFGKNKTVCDVLGQKSHLSC